MEQELASRGGAPARPLPGVGSANLLYFLTMIPVVTLGAAMQAGSFAWGLLATEVLLILLPTLLFVRRIGLSAREALRLRWPGRRLALLSLCIGAGGWFLATWLERVMSGLFGYVILGPPDMYPRTAGQALLLFLALSVVGPLCEEVMFRGYLQRAYEQRGAWAGIVMGGLLFAFFHMRLKGLLPLLPASLALGYVVWRSGSLLTGLLLHVANNALAAGLLVTASLRPDLLQGVDLASPLLALLGATAMLAGLWLFARDAPRPLPAAPQRRESWLRRNWALFGAALIYVFLAGAEFVVGRFPQALALGLPVQLAQAPWREPVRWRYELRDGSGQVVGQAQCQLSPIGDLFVLDCRVDQDAFEVRRDGRAFVSAAVVRRQTTYWRQEDLGLAAAEGCYESGGSRLDFVLRPESEGAELALVASKDGGQAERLALWPGALLGGEWPWRLAALPFSLGYSRAATLAWPGCATGEDCDGPSVEQGHVVVRGAEPAATPAGAFVAWRVQVGDGATAWYDAEPPHTLIHYDDGTVSYLLVAVERGESAY